MTDTTPNLALPEIIAAQAQKHVTHNEALRALDALVQLAVLDRDLVAPPSSPDEGERWLVAASPSGGWAGHAGHIAAWQDGGWEFYTPRTGWLVYVADEAALIAWDGSAWQPAIEVSGTAFQNLTLLGIGTTADSTNPVSATLNNVLWTAKTVANGGSGDLRYKLSKESAAKTASLLFQDNFSGRAEFGLTGDDDFHVKVSSDGTVWKEAIVIDRSSGQVSFPQGGASADLELTLAQLSLGLADSLGAAQWSGNAGNRFADSFRALTYVDTAGATNLDSGTTGLLKPTTTSGSSPSYANTGGTGNRSSSITVSTTVASDGASGPVSNLVNGSVSDDASGAWWNFGNDAAAGKYFRFDFGSGVSKVITEATWKQSGSASHGTWKWQGSNDASSWTDIGSSFTLGGATTQTQTSLSGNGAGYRYYQLLGVSGNFSQSALNREIEFKIDTYSASTTNSLTVASTALTAASAPGSAKLVARVKEVSSITLNTDLIASISRNGGSNWTAFTLTKRFTANGISLYESATLDISAQPSGTSMKWKIATANNKMAEIHDVYLYWA